ncbi:MAG: BspA family leucine-rich repeat surface protein [Erysipelotrichaceae bacterium]|nr:BspA family leucine-rich repeat surface protein [Erysipelotrichaceae bacterium]
MKKIYRILLILLLVISNLLTSRNIVLAEDDHEESEEVLDFVEIPQEEADEDVSLEITEDGGEETKIPVECSISLPDTAILFASSADDGEQEELLNAYINSLLYDETLSSYGKVENLFGYEIQKKKENGKKLENLDLNLYNAIKDKIVLTAAGELASTVYTLDAVDDLHLVFTKEDLGVSEIWQLVDGMYSPTPEAAAAINEWLSYDTGLILSALLFDYPYELYWFDKTAGVSIAPESDSLSVNTTDLNDLIIETPFIATFHVAREYQNGEDLKVDTNIGSTIHNAIDNARDIVNTYASYNSDYEILKAYKNEISALTEYNFDALEAGVSYGNPWQLIYVFDEDDSTDVVCEGYSKAFQYLCDLTDFNNDTVCAYTVTGTMDGGTGAGNHMWNIVTMEDGRNYLVDVTNCDDGSAGYPDKLFLKGIDESDTTGSVEDGYVFRSEGMPDIRYVYDGNTKSIYADTELTIARGEYEAQETIPEGSLAYAILTDDGDLVFFRSETALSAGYQTLTIHDEIFTGYVYTGIEEYTGFDPAWLSANTDIVNVYALDVIRPLTMSRWFSGAVNLESFSVTNIDASQVDSMFFMFYNCSKLESLDLRGLNPSSATRMSSMFSNCSNLEEILFGNGFVGSSVTNLSTMFYQCTSLKKLDLSGFDTSSVTDMSSMFSGCTNLKELNLDGFDTSSVTSMRGMFSGCSSLKELDLSDFVTTNVEDMNGLFFNCSALERLDLSNFDLTSISDDSTSGMTYMFNGCNMLSSITLGTGWSQWKHNAKLPAGNWVNDTIGTKTADELYDDYVENRSQWAGEWHRTHEAYAVLDGDGNLIFTRSFNTYAGGETTLVDRRGDTYTGTVFANVESTPYNDESMPWYSYRNGIRKVYAVDTIKPQNMYDWFYKCSNLESFDSQNFDTSNTESMIQMFYECRNLTSVDLSNFDTSNVESFSGMFRSCENLESLDLRSFNTSKVRNMEAMFYMCYKLKNLDISSFDTSNVISTLVMFSRCYELEHIDVSHFDTSKVTIMRDMFEECKAVKQLDLSNFDTSNVEYMDRMFYHCESLTSLDLSSFDTSNAKTMNYMFHSCKALVSLDLSNFNTAKVIDMNGMFQNCTSLTSLNVGSFDTSNVTNMNTMFSGLEQMRSLDVSNLDTSKVTDMGWMFSHNYNLETIIFSDAFDTSSVVSMPLIFGFDEKLRSLDLSSFDLTNAVEIYGLFTGCYDLTSVKLGSGWSKWSSESLLPAGMWANDASGLILSETQLQQQYPSHASEWAGIWAQIDSYAVLTGEGDLIFTNSTNEYVNGSYGTLIDRNGSSFSGWIFADVTGSDNDGSNVKWSAYRSLIKNVYAVDIIKPVTMDSWFMNCNALKSFSSENFDTSAVRRMDYLFAYCSNLEAIDVSHFDTSQARYIDFMFYCCRNITELDLSNFNTANVTHMYEMFGDCSRLVSLDISSFSTESATTTHSMFAGCYALESIRLGKNWTVWAPDNLLPSNYWTNGTEYLRNDDLAARYPANADQWAGVWSRVDSINGDIIDTDLPEYVPGGLWIAGVVDNKIYTGSAITQEFRVYDDKKLLEAGKDYSVKYANNTNAGTATITITGSGNYQGTLQKTFTIEPVELNEYNTTVTLSKDMFAYNGKVQKPKVNSVVYNGKKLKANTDYAVKYWTPDSTDAPWEYNIEIIGKNNYRSEGFYVDYYITDMMPVNSLTISGIKDQVYTGSPIVQDKLVIKNGKEVIYDAVNGINKGYVTIDYQNNTETGTASMIITGNYFLDYTGEIVKTFKITGTAISKAKMTGFEASKPYNNGAPMLQDVVLEYGGSALIPGTDYVITYENNIDIGTATMIITGKSGFTGTVKKTFKITGNPFNAKTVTVEGLADSYPYKGEKWEPVPDLLDNGTHSYIGSENYDITYSSNINAGTASITFTGKGAYTGSFSKTFKIAKLKITDSEVTLNSSYAYTKGGVKPQPVIRVNGRKLVLNTDYTLSYKNNAKLGAATLTIKGKGNYEDSLSIDFTVRKATSAGLKMTAADKVYTGKASAMSTTVVITDSNGAKLASGTDYEKNIVYTYDEDTVVNDTEPRTAGDQVLKTDIIPVGTRIKASVTLKGNYSGNISEVFRIIAGDLSKATVTIPVQYYSGSPVYLNESEIKVVLNKEVLSMDDDFEIVSYANNTAKGTATVTIAGKGNYGGSKTVKFSITQRSMGVVIRFNGNGATSGSMKDIILYKGSVKLPKSTYKKGTDVSIRWMDDSGIYLDFGDELFYDDYLPGTVITLYAVY